MATSVVLQSRTFFVLQHGISGGTIEGILVRRGEWRLQRPGIGAPSMVYGPKAQALEAAAALLEREAADIEWESTR